MRERLDRRRPLQTDKRAHDLRARMGTFWCSAALAGTLLAAGPRGVEITLSAVALRAFPAMILGGLDSPSGAVVGGLTIGVVEVVSAAYVTPNAPWLGENVHVVVPYFVMIAVLLVRPYGLFGTKEVIRA